MKLGMILTGILLIIGAVAEHAVTPILIEKTNALANQLETGFFPQMPNMPSITDMNSKVIKFESFTGLIEKVSGYSVLATALAGIGAVTWGVLAKNRKKIMQSSQQSSAIDILKKRLAKGEITRDQFYSLKNDVS